MSGYGTRVQSVNDTCSHAPIVLCCVVHHFGTRCSAADDKIELIDSSMPSYDARIQSAKLLLELDQLAVACEVLERLMDEDDEVVEVWYLLGLANHFQNTADSIQVGLEYFLEARHLYQKLECEQQSILDHMQHILSQFAPDVLAAGGTCAVCVCARE